MAKELRNEFATEAIAVRTDVGKKDEVVAMVAAAEQKWGTVDILVNNAWGGGNINRVEWKSEDDLDHGMRLAFKGPFWAMQAAFPIMKAPVAATSSTSARSTA